MGVREFGRVQYHACVQGSFADSETYGSFAEIQGSFAEMEVLFAQMEDCTLVFQIARIQGSLAETTGSFACMP